MRVVGWVNVGAVGLGQVESIRGRSDQSDVGAVSLVNAGAVGLE